MHIKRLHIENFKKFNGSYDIEFNQGINILVGDNEIGKSTIIEAVYLGLTGIYRGGYLKNNLTSYLFNQTVVDNFLQAVNSGQNVDLPHILIELYFGDNQCPEMMGSGNSLHDNNACGLSLRIEFNEEAYKEEYQELLKDGILTLPMEYYQVIWSSFSRDRHITSRSIPLKAAFIDSSNYRHQNDSDVYISRIVRDLLSEKEIVDISQAFRKIQEGFMEDTAVSTINQHISRNADISSKDVSLSVDFSSRNAWEDFMTTYLDKIPFSNIGKGEQCIVKTKLALSHKKTTESNLLLIEEPENHLSYSKLNELIKAIAEKNEGKQVIISTHSSFVANKLGLDSIILLGNDKNMKLNDLSPNTVKYFKKLSGYDTLRLLLCKKAILVEGDSDDLVVQKAYLEKYKHLPIEDGIDVISVRSLSFLRYLEIAKKLDLKVAVVTDNDGDIEALVNKYRDYTSCDNINIYYDGIVDSGDMTGFNYNTLEPKLLKFNSLDILNSILGKEYTDEKDLLKYMHDHKTDCALYIFECDDLTDFTFPTYILQAIDNEQ